MADFDERKAFKRKFVRGFAVGILGPLITIGLFNFVIDPYQLSKNRIAGINDAISHRNFLGESAIQNAYVAYAKGDAAAASIIGTSTIARGIRVEENPNVEKIALGGLVLTEGLEIAQTIIDESNVPKVILIELGSTKKVKRGQPLSFQMRFLQVRTTSESARLLHRSISARGRKYKFFQRATTTELPELPELLEKKKELLEYLQSNIKQLDSLILTLKPNKSIKHKVVFFTSLLPAGFVDLLEIQQLVDSTHREARRIVKEADQEEESIEFGFIGVMGTPIGSEYLPWTESFHDGWYDFNHYKPVIGEQLLKYLLMYASTED